MITAEQMQAAFDFVDANFGGDIDRAISRLGEIESAAVRDALAMFDQCRSAAKRAGAKIRRRALSSTRQTGRRGESQQS